MNVRVESIDLQTQISQTTINQLIIFFVDYSLNMLYTDFDRSSCSVVQLKGGWVAFEKEEP